MNTSRHKVLATIRRLGPVGQATVAKTVGLSLPSVMTIVRRLVDKGLVREAGVGASTGGKPPKLLEFVPDSYYSVGVDIGATKTICILMDGAAIIGRTTMATDFRHGPDRVLSRVIGGIESLLASCRIDPEKLMGIGIAAPGLFEPGSMRLEYSPLLHWRHVDLTTPIGRHFHTFACADNSVRVTLYGERIHGAAQTSENFMCINLGYGIGGALVLHNRVYTGMMGTAGEIGHIVVQPRGPLCNCGGRGCLEAICSARAIVRDAEEAMRAGKAAILRRWAEEGETLNAALVFKAAGHGDAGCLRVVRRAMTTMGNFIGGIINFLDLELVILEGGLAQAGPAFLEILEKAAATSKMALAGRGTRLLVSALGMDATAIGAAAMVVELQLESDHFLAG